MARTFDIVVALPFAYQDGIDKYSGIMRYLSTRQVDWNVKIVRECADVRRFQRLVADGIDGAIVDVMLANLLSNFPIGRKPLVAIDFLNTGLIEPGVSMSAFVDSDSRDIGVSAVKFLHKQGNYRSFGYVGAEVKYAWSEDRGKVFARELAARKIACGMFTVPLQYGRLRERRLAAWLRRLEKPAALLVANDEMAVQVLEVCGRTGIKVPDDVGVLGVDNETVTCSHSHPPLSSVQPDFEQAGFDAARLMDAMLRGKRFPKHVFCKVKEVVARQSTNAPSSAGSLVRTAEEIIRRRALSGLNVTQLAAEMKVSRRLLDRRFRQINGVSVLSAIRKIRLERARYLLESTKLSIADISRQSGFSFDSADRERRLYLAYGFADGGRSTNAWDQCRLLATIPAGCTTLDDVVLPDDFAVSGRVARAFLSGLRLTSLDYVQDGLALQYDAIENAGRGRKLCLLLAAAGEFRRG